MTDENEPKIIVDDDWKSQVQAEKEALKKTEESKKVDAVGGDTDAETNPFEDLPDASFESLVSLLSAQTIGALGFLPNSETGEDSPGNRELARHFIDTLGILEEKTAGNLTEEESSLLTETLHHLRMAFLQG